MATAISLDLQMFLKTPSTPPTQPDEDLGSSCPPGGRGSCTGSLEGDWTVGIEIIKPQIRRSNSFTSRRLSYRYIDTCVKLSYIQGILCFYFFFHNSKCWKRTYTSIKGKND